MISEEEAKEKFLSAVATCDGLVWSACKLTGLNQKVHEKWLTKDEDYAKRFHAVLEGVNDFVESAMFKRIRAGDWNAIKFYLSSKCRHRGYSNDPSVNINALSVGGSGAKSLSDLLGSIPMEALPTKEELKQIGADRPRIMGLPEEVLNESAESQVRGDASAVLAEAGR